MSATTILEAYDTQMLDYSGDFDVAMQTAASSSDSWLFNSETVMDQDAHHDSQSLGVPDNESVEVDMEGYANADNESIEYEMADDEERGYQPQGGDLLDVEVYDASQAHSPMPLPAINVPQSEPDNIIDYSVQPTPAPVYSDPHNDIAPPDLPPTLGGYEASNLEFPADDNISNSSPRFEVNQQLASDANAASTDSLSEHPADSSIIIPPAVSDDTAFHDSSGSEAFGDTAESADKDAIHDVAQNEDSHFAHHGEEVESGTIPSHPQDHEEATHTEQPHESADAAEPYESTEDYHNETQEYHEYNEGFASAADPHEISEGIYIDPPPAVLLSLPISDVVYLFNQPPMRSSSNSPTEDTGTHVWTVLLHSRPTLYYEPLTNVFEALRQEEYMTQIPELAEGELALDAYDLQLVVSEDSVHARDITLHDLNVLHDGSDLSGPLRLHLHIIIPRFILRYHMLRDQISRLNLVAEGGDNEQVALHEGQNVDAYHEENQNQKEAGEQDNEGKPEEHLEPTESPPKAAESAGQNYEATGDILNSTSEDYHQVHGEEVQALEDQNENADADTATEVHEDDAEEKPDVDAVHDEGDSTASRLGDGEPAEYEEYAEVEGYDEQYGEILQEGSDDNPDNDQTLEYSEATEHTAADETKESLSETDSAQVPAAADLAEQGYEPERASEGGDTEDTSEETHTNEDNLHDHDEQDHDSEDTISKHGVVGPDESDSNFVAVYEYEHVVLTDPVAETSISQSQGHQEQEHAYPELPDDPEWDDDLDGEGDIDEEWAADPDDRISNQSSATLSSLASSSKRGHDEVDSDNENDGNEPSPQNNSPDPKRPRVR